MTETSKQSKTKFIWLKKSRQTSDSGGGVQVANEQHCEWDIEMTTYLNLKGHYLSRWLKCSGISGVVHTTLWIY